jgi:intracellular sulfur oxidation DsrE/DsrF family protein
MKRILIFLFLLNILVLYSQEKGIILENTGNVYRVDNPDLEFEKNKEYKVIFDVYTDSPNIDMDNPMLKTVARYLQIHTQYGIPRENLKIAVIIHGLASKNVLSDEAYKKEFKVKNPNTNLIKALKDNDIEIFVCGQSYAGKGYEAKDKSPHVKMALSAMTALVWYQTAGYQIINFN